ncbi:hypothetical protein Bbelb_098160 [Branchiostoma belcheri]|nr:hypothetical protein Bbelb_098160 [Branchiostoma belcheri]
MRTSARRGGFAARPLRGCPGFSYGRGEEQIEVVPSVKGNQMTGLVPASITKLQEKPVTRSLTAADQPCQLQGLALSLKPSDTDTRLTARLTLRITQCDSQDGRTRPRPQTGPHPAPTPELTPLTPTLANLRLFYRPQPSLVFILYGSPNLIQSETNPVEISRRAEVALVGRVTLPAPYRHRGAPADVVTRLQHAPEPSPQTNAMRQTAPQDAPPVSLGDPSDSTKHSLGARLFPGPTQASISAPGPTQASSLTPGPTQASSSAPGPTQASSRALV